MFKTIREFLAPPIFADEEKTRQASLLNIILIAVIVVLIFANGSSLIISLINNQGLTNLTGSVVGIVIMGVGFYLMRQGYVSLSSILLIGVMIGVVTFGFLSSNGARSPIVVGYMLAIIAAGLLLSGRGAVIAAGITLSLLLGINYLDTNGTITIPKTEITSTSIAIIYTSNFIVAALLLRLAANSIEKALQLARANEQEVRALATTLEQRVQERTRALETSTDVSRRLSTILDPQQLMVEVVEQVKSAFNYYHAHIYLLDENREFLRMAGGTGKVGQTLLQQGHKLAMGQGLVGRAAATNTSILIPDVSQEPGWLPNPLLPETRAEIAVPISLGGQPIGVLDVQNNTINSLTSSDVDLLQALANQVAIAIQNARLYAQAQQQAERAAFLNDVSQKIQNATTIERVVKIAAQELGQLLGADQTIIQIGTDTKHQNGTTA
ncbi:MAG: GAF domain-containing protein [Anaerolineae bacterium]|nr:GAF domain-containing protein [Anaerolineae bacterium]